MNPAEVASDWSGLPATSVRLTALPTCVPVAFVQEVGDPVGPHS